MSPVLLVASVPVLITQMFRDRESARSVARGTLDLGLCEACGMARNAAFDPELVEYAGEYENSQMFSGTFQVYARALARSLVRRHGLSGGRVVEIGCGQGEFLEMLLDEGIGEAVGFDPAYRGMPEGRGGRLSFVADVYDERSTSEGADLVVCRHVLEHCDDPYELLERVRATIGDRDTVVYFEVPNGEFVMSRSGMWDLIYQHVSYFTAPSLRLLFEQSGFDVARVETVFDGQFLAVEARPANRVEAPEVDWRAVERVAARAWAFAALWEDTMRHWEQEARRWEVAGGESMLWGAGAKGLTFLSLTPAGRLVSYVTDVNPRKQGTFVPPDGQPVLAPDAIAGRSVGRVVIANRAYEREIRESLGGLGLDPEITVL